MHGEKFHITFNFIKLKLLDRMTLNILRRKKNDFVFLLDFGL